MELTLDESGEPITINRLPGANEVRFSDPPPVFSHPGNIPRSFKPINQFSSPKKRTVSSLFPHRNIANFAFVP